MSSFIQESAVISAVKKVAPAVVSIIITKDIPKIQPYMLPPQFFGLPFPFGLPLPLPGIPGEPSPDLEPAPPLMNIAPSKSNAEKPVAPEATKPDQVQIKVPDPNAKKMQIGGGSGSIVDPDGIILTNKHVILETDAEYTVIANDDKKYSAKVLARDPINDIAILKIDARGLPAMELGDSSRLQLGQTVISIGNALGEFTNTVSTGVVSGLSRYITAQAGLHGHTEELRGLIQTDAAINPGNSGGPLIDLNGKVIGINSATVIGAENIGFAIPINTAKRDLADVKKHGRIIKPSLGVRYVTISKELQEKNHLPVDYGAWIIREPIPGDFAVLPDSPAAKAGIRENDILLEFNNCRVTKKEPLQDLVEKCAVGQKVKIKLLRGQEKLVVKAVLIERK